MTTIAALRYTLCLVVGVVAGLARRIRGGPCPCRFCRAHRQFIEASARLYRTELPGLPPPTTGGGA